MGVAQWLAPQLHWECKYPVLRAGELAHLLPLLDAFEQRIGDQHGAGRIRRFNIIHDLLHHAALDADGFGQPVDILRLQAKHL